MAAPPAPPSPVAPEDPLVEAGEGSSATGGRPALLLALLVVVLGVAGGGLVAALAVGGGGDGDDRPDDDAVLLAVATAYDLDVAGAGCVVDRLDAERALDGDLARRLVAAALGGASVSGRSPAVPTAEPAPGAGGPADLPTDAALVDAVTACTGGDLLGALTAAGVPEFVAGCAADTLADGGPAAVAAASADPLADPSASRSAVAACALDHLATAVRDGAGVAVADAQCVAGEVLERVGLEAVLASIDALAVTAEVAAAAAASATACAGG